MKYFNQGPHDGLCGLICALNAVRFLQQRTDHMFSRSDDQTFFDEAVECLFRVPGCDLRILKGDPMFGGVDPFQVRDLCRLIAERISMPITVSLSVGEARIPIVSRYRALMDNHDKFALIAPYRDGSHWVTLLPVDEKSYRLIDQGRAFITPLRGGNRPRLATDTAIVLTA